MNLLDEVLSAFVSGIGDLIAFLQTILDAISLFG